MAFKSNPRIRGENKGLTQKQIERRATRAYSILDSISTLPSQDNETIDAQLLNKWIDFARAGCIEKNRRKIGDEQIGQILSHSPIGTDGIWPHEFVREILERCESPDIERGMLVGLKNQRGVTTRELFDGGKPEKEIFIKYDAWAKKLRHLYPRTANVLQSIADSYSSEAKVQDKGVEYLKSTWCR